MSIFLLAVALEAGKFLVASKELADPNFSKTVVLLLKYGEDGSLGLVINRRSNTPLSQILKEIPEAKDRSDPIFLGGPVAKAGAMALLRSPARLEEEERIFGDVYRLNRKSLENALEKKTGASRLHIYLGYAGWGAGQLEYEVKQGMWHTLKADAATVFDSDPDTVWTRLVRQFAVRYAYMDGLDTLRSSTAPAVGKSSGTFWVTLPVAAHSVPR